MVMIDLDYVARNRISGHLSAR